MVKTTKAQREALDSLHGRMLASYIEAVKRGERPTPPPTYREFRKTVQPEFCGHGAILVRWCGMTIGIETDGYTHS